MKKLHLVLWAFISLIALTSCTGNKKISDNDNLQSALTVDNLLEVADQNIDDTVSVEGDK